MLEEIIRIRHDLHAHPSLSDEESYAHDLIADYLRRLNPTRLFLHVGGYGVIAQFGDDNSEFVAFRVDTDALPIQEQLPVSYASCVSGVSHKCGHDGHTAIALRLAELLHERQKLANNSHAVLLLFQPAEETGKGSMRILESGVLQKYNISAFYGLHNLPGFPQGKLVFKYGTFAAASVGWILHLKGRQTHAAFPEKGINPALAVAEIIQKVLAGNNSPENEKKFHQATLIYTRIGAEAFGTSAGDADVMFTLRAFCNSEMELWKKEVVAIAYRVAAMHKLSLSVEWKEEFRATENHNEVVSHLVSVAEKNGFDHVVIQQSFRWSEDFSEYLLRYPGAFWGIGAGEECPELHHPDYNFPDEILETAALFAEKLLTEQIF